MVHVISSHAMLHGIYTICLLPEFGQKMVDLIELSENHKIIGIWITMQNSSCTVHCIHCMPFINEVDSQLFKYIERLMCSAVVYFSVCTSLLSQLVCLHHQCH